MRAGYRINLWSELKSDYYRAIGKNILEENKTKTESLIDSFVDKDGNIIASKVVASWFPPVKAHVFLSHSHKDNDDILGFAGFLYSKFNIISFIDASVWGFSEKLLKKIDNKFCRTSENGIYDYELRNKTTSHVYMMLSVALMEMIDSCDCVIFVDTPNSIHIQDSVDSKSTLSPWIYSEIAMTRLVRVRDDVGVRSRVSKEVAFAEDMKILYDVKLDHLKELTVEKIERWIKESKYTDVAKNLNILHEIMSVE